MKKNKELEEIKSKYFQLDQRKYLPLREPNLDVLKPTELKMVDDILNKLGEMNATQISEYVHGDIPYQVADIGKNINYEYALYREKPYSVRQYDKI